MTASGPLGVSVVLPDGEEVAVGTLRIARGRGHETATFAYAASYLADPRAYAVDPELPLRAGTFVTRPDGGLFGAMSDFPAPSRGECSLANTTPYTGAIRWEAVAEGRFAIAFEHGEVLVGADVQVDSLNWDKLVVHVCGAATADSAVVVLSGGPRAEW